MQRHFCYFWYIQAQFSQCQCRPGVITFVMYCNILWMRVFITMHGLGIVAFSYQALKFKNVHVSAKIFFEYLLCKKALILRSKFYKSCWLFYELRSALHCANNFYQYWLQDVLVDKTLRSCHGQVYFHCGQVHFCYIKVVVYYEVWYVRLCFSAIETLQFIGDIQ